ncbi:phage minor head protein [Neptunicella sp. SCSIO 80796]|uniref:phage minor head protein n=1 Tax=Neptunicella plasticusilytica TaxID=3117012 RepID=UPI003A4DB2AA
MPAQYGSLPFTEAIDFFRNKLDMPSERWADVWRDQHNLAFTVAGATKADLLADMRGLVDSAIAEGKSLNWFKSQFKGLVKQHGWQHTGKAAWRANIIYSTNMRQSYNAGRYQQLQTFEYWRYKHGDSRYPRPAHAAKDGTILPKDSPFWQVWFPQNGWGCKCKVFGETRQSLARKGLKVSKEPVIETREWTDKATGEVHYVPVGIDPGFDYTPGKVDQVTKLRQQRANIPPLAERLPKRHIPSAFSTVPTVNVHGLNQVTESVLNSSAAPQMQQLVGFIQQRDIKTVVVKNVEMGRGKQSWDIAEQVGQYLGVNKWQARNRYTVSKTDKPEGFTSIAYDHVTLKAATKHNLKKVDVNKMLSGINAILKDGASGTGQHTWPGGYKRWFASTEATGNMSDSTSRYLTWLHEMGHQVHYKAGTPARPTSQFLTEYGNVNDREWFAEHFVFWVLAREQLAGEWADIAKWFDNVMKQVLK